MKRASYGLLSQYRAVRCAQRARIWRGLRPAGELVREYARINSGRAVHYSTGGY